jgi:Spy/CpxP family protein refolding chaperone
MSLNRTLLASMVTVGTVAIAFAPAAAADPVWPVAGSQSAADTIRDLESQGYNVQINWANGYSTQDLNRCTVNAIHNPDRSATSPPPEFTTVYIDVQCPHNDDWDWGGVGFGF